MFVVVVTSCSDCNSQSVALFENKPSQAQIDEVDDKNGGMMCNKINVYELVVGEIKTGEISEY